MEEVLARKKQKTEGSRKSHRLSDGPSKNVKYMRLSQVEEVEELQGVWGVRDGLGARRIRPTWILGGSSSAKLKLKKPSTKATIGTL